jgi:TRAP-type C4-dicarboxylate transport system substrate-binding protein
VTFQKLSAKLKARASPKEGPRRRQPHTKGISVGIFIKKKSHGGINTKWTELAVAVPVSRVKAVKKPWVILQGTPLQLTPLDRWRSSDGKLPANPWENILRVREGTTLERTRFRKNRVTRKGGRKMKRIRMIATLLVVILCLAGLQWASADSAIKPMKLKVAGVFPPPDVSMMSELMKAWQDEVTKRTKGAITFENFWGAALGAPAEHIDLVKNNVVQIAQTHEWYTPSRFPVGNFEYVFPFGPTDYVLVAKAMRKIRAEIPQFVKDETRENVVMICDPPGGVYDFMSVNPVKTLADFKGEKVSLVGRYFGRWLPPGATAVVRPAGERYDLLRGGVVTMDLLPFDLFYAFKIDEVTKYFIDARLITACWGPVLMNLTTFKKLPPDVQKIFLEAGKDVELKAATEIIPKWWVKCEKAWKEKGIQFEHISDADIKTWAHSLEDIPAEWAKEVEKKGIPGFKIVNRWQEITTEMGFKWARKWGVKK